MKHCNYISTCIIFLAVLTAVSVITVVVLTSKLGWKVIYEGKGGEWGMTYDFQKYSEYFYLSGIDYAVYENKDSG